MFSINVSDINVKDRVGVVETVADDKRAILSVELITPYSDSAMVGGPKMIVDIKRVNSWR